MGQTGCVICLVGKYTPAGVGAPTCSKCAGGRYHQGWGNTYSSWEECDTCLAGTYSTPGTAVCKICPVGTGSSIAAPFCESCQAGFYRPNQAMLTWAGVLQAFQEGIACDTDAGRSDDRCPSGCLSCTPGKFSTARAEACFSCPAGFKSSARSPYCNECTMGTFQDLTEKSECKNCDAGKFTNTSAALFCISCSAGKHASSDGKLCDNCQPGKYSDLPGLPACKLCAAGLFREGRGFSSCVQCAPGYFSVQKDDAPILSCSKCVIGKFAPEKSQANDCLPCSAGTYSDEEGQRICKNCTAGTYKQIPSTAGCNDCDKGSYSSVDRAFKCHKCPANTRQHLKGKKLCFACKPGRFSSAGNSDASCSPPVPRESPMPPILEAIHRVNVTADDDTHNSSTTELSQSKTIVLTIGLNATWRQTVVGKDDSITAVVVEWSADNDFRDISTNIKLFSLPSNIEKESIEVTLELSNPVLYKGWYFRVKYVLQQEGWVTRASVFSPPWHTIGAQDTSCTDIQYLRTRKMDNPAASFLPLYLKSAGLQAWSHNGVVRRCMKCPVGGHCVGHVTEQEVMPKWGFWRIPWASGKPLNETFAACAGNEDCIGATKSNEIDVVYRQINPIPTNQDRQYRQRQRCVFKVKGADEALACCREQPKPKLGEAGKCEREHGCVCESSRGKNASGIGERCQEGREPDSVVCAVCSHNYMRTRGGCTKCFQAGTRFVLIAVVLGCIVFGTAAASKIWAKMHLYRTAWRDVGRIIIINISLMQINTSLENMIPIAWPKEWLDFKEYFEWADVDLMSLTGTTCVSGINFYHTFAVMGSLPYIILGASMLYFFIQKSTLKHRLEHMPEKKKKELEHHALVEAFLVGDTDASGILGANELALLLNRELHLEDFQDGKHMVDSKHAVQVIKSVTGNPNAHTLTLAQFMGAMETGKFNKVVNQICKLPAHHGDASTDAMLEYVMERSLFASSFMVAAQLLLLAHSPVSKKVFLYHLCRNIAGKSFVRSDYSVECFSPAWGSFYPLVIFVLLTFTAGFPAFLCYMFYRNRKKLYTREVFSRMGFLYERYIHGSEWWEVHEMLRKVMLTGVLLFFSERPMVRAVFAVIVCCCVIIDLNYFQPHRNMVVFWIDQVANMSATIKYLFAVVLAAGGGAGEGNTSEDMQAAEVSTIGHLLILSDVAVILASVLGIGACFFIIHHNIHKRGASTRILPLGLDTDGDGVPDYEYIDVPTIQEHRRHRDEYEPKVINFDLDQAGFIQPAEKQREAKRVQNNHRQTKKRQERELFKRKSMQLLKLKRRLEKRQSTIKPSKGAVLNWSQEGGKESQPPTQDSVLNWSQEGSVETDAKRKKKNKKKKKKRSKNPHFSEEMLEREDVLRARLLRSSIVKKLETMDGNKKVNKKSLEKMLATGGVADHGELHDQILYHIDPNHDGNTTVGEIMEWLHHKNYSNGALTKKRSQGVLQRNQDVPESNKSNELKQSYSKELLAQEDRLRAKLNKSAFAEKLKEMPANKRVNTKSVAKLLRGKLFSSFLVCCTSLLLLSFCVQLFFLILTILLCSPYFLPCLSLVRLWCFGLLK